ENDDASFPSSAMRCYRNRSCLELRAPCAHCCSARSLSFLLGFLPSTLASAEQVFCIVGPAQNAVARLLHQPQHARHVDAHPIAAPLLHLSADEDRFD